VQSLCLMMSFKVLSEFAVHIVTFLRGKTVTYYNNFKTKNIINTETIKRKCQQNLKL